MAFTNNILIVGAPGDNNSTGAVYVWTVNGQNFQMQQKLVPPFQVPSLFGYAIAFNSSFLFVGAPKAGDVYIFKLNAGSFSQEGSPKQSPDGNTNSAFGISVAATSTLLVVGDTTDNNSTGKVHFYQIDSNSNWNYEDSIVPNDGNVSDNFGCAVAVLDPNVVIAAKNPDLSAGGVYVFTYQNFSFAQTHKFVSAVNATGDTFGNFLQFTSNVLLIGSAGSETVYLYTYDGTSFNPTNTFVATNDAAKGHFFGSQGYMFVSATRFDVAITAAYANGGTGEVYIYNALVVPLSATNTLMVTYNNATFGSSLVFTDNTLVVGASGYNGNTGRSGAMLIYFVSSGSTLVSQFITILVAFFVSILFNLKARNKVFVLI